MQWYAVMKFFKRQQWLILNTEIICLPISKLSISVWIPLEYHCIGEVNKKLILKTFLHKSLLPYYGTSQRFQPAGGNAETVKAVLKGLGIKMPLYICLTPSSISLHKITLIRTLIRCFLLSISPDRKRTLGIYWKQLHIRLWSVARMF